MSFHHCISAIQDPDPRALYVQLEEIRRGMVGRASTPEEQAKIADLNARQHAIYSAGFADGLRASETSFQKVTSDARAPLRSADTASNGRGGSVSHAAQDNPTPGMLPTETGMPSTSKNIGIDASTTADTPAQDHSTTPVSPELRAAQSAEAVHAVQREPDAGRLSAADVAELRQVIAALGETEGNARALEEAAVCIVRTAI